MVSVVTVAHLNLVDRLEARRRVSCLALPALLERCRFTLVSFVADEALRGNLPFPRAREEELLYILRGLLQLRLWPGTLWAALSDSPTTYSSDQPSKLTYSLAQMNGFLTSYPEIDQSLAPSALIADAVKRSTKAHLFHFYDVFCEIVAIPRKPPSVWVAADKPQQTSTDGDHRRTHSLSWNSVLSSDTTHSKAIELDARSLAKQCLKELRSEMGLGQ